MAHFAELDENSIVMRVIVIDNNVLLDYNGVEIEYLGISFCKNLYGINTKWVQTSYNNSFRKIYACIGYIYDQENDCFKPPQPSYGNWTFDEVLWKWIENEY